MRAYYPAPARPSAWHGSPVAAAGTRRANPFGPLPRDPLRVALAVILILTVGRIHEQYPLLMMMRPGLLATGVAVASAFFFPHQLVRGGLLRTWPMQVVVALAVLTLVGAPLGLSMGASVMYIINVYSKVLLFIFLLALSIRTAGELRFFVNGYLIGAALICYLAIFVIQLQTYAGSHTARLDGSAFGSFDGNDIGVVVIIALPLAVLVFQTAERRGKILMSLLLAGIGITIAKSGSRGAFLGLALIGFVLLVQMKGVSVAKRVGVVLAVIIALVVSAPPGYWEQMQTIVDPSQDYNVTSEDGRLALWGRGFGYMTRFPLTGVGINNFGRAEGTISEKARKHVPGTGLVFTAPHNSFVQAAAEVGIPGLLLFSALVFGGMIGSRLLQRRMPRAWEWGDPEQRYLFLATRYLPLSYLGFALTGSFVSFAFSAPIYVLTAFVAGLQVAIEEKLARSGAGSGGAAPRSVASASPYRPCVARRFPARAEGL